MNKDILRRLEKLESRLRTAYKQPAPVPLAFYLIGYFSTTYDPMQSPFLNYAIALGCQSALEFHSLTAEQVAERHRTAWARICRRRKIDPATLEPRERFDRLLKQLDKAGIVPAKTWEAAAAPVT
jgi:hypothetical protein